MYDKSIIFSGKGLWTNGRSDISEWNDPGGTDKNGMAVASLVLGIIAVCCCCVSGLSLVLGILAIVFSVLSRKNPAKSGLGTAGLVLGIIASVLAIVSIIVAQTDWYQTTVTQQLIDTFGDQYADMLN